MDDRRAALAESVTTVELRPVQLRPGYRMDDVDRLLDELASRLRRGDPLAPVVSSSEPSVVRFRESYAQDPVRRLIRELLVELGETVPPWVTTG